jgi:hypothetical protein
MPAIVKEKSVTLVNRRPEDFYLLRFYVANRDDAEQICHHVINHRLATKAVFMDEVEEIRAKSEVLKDSKCVVELETDLEKVYELQAEIKSSFMIPPEVIIMKAI